MATPASPAPLEPPLLLVPVEATLLAALDEPAIVPVLELPAPTDEVVPCVPPLVPAAPVEDPPEVPLEKPPGGGVEELHPAAHANATRPTRWVRVFGDMQCVLEWVRQ
jgi:hypothetical protein